MSGNQVITSQDTSLTENHLKQDQIKAGFFGKIFGSNDHVSTYIAASVLLLSLLGGLIITIFIADSTLGMSKKDVWTTLSPIITSCMGFIFGKKA